MFTYELKIWKSFTLDLLNSQKSLRIFIAKKKKYNKIIILDQF